MNTCLDAHTSNLGIMATKWCVLFLSLLPQGSMGAMVSLVNQV